MAQKLFYELFLIFFQPLLQAQSVDFIFKPGPLVPPTKGEVWPRVQYEDKLDNSFFSFIPGTFSFKNTGNMCNTLKEALERYENILAKHNRYIKTSYYKKRDCKKIDNPNFLKPLTSLEVKLSGECNDHEYPSLKTKETYVLNVTSNIQKLSSETLWGILRGLETFSQLIYLTDDYACHLIETTSIYDYPRFPHRGVLLDTSRHYQTKQNILQFLDTMSYNKLNVFHWHITDDYSFPYISTTFPELSQKGAFHPVVMVYDQVFVKKVQEYARKRGIRVLMEFDTPGHTLSWGLGNPDLLTACINVPSLKWGPINPIKNSTYTFIYKFFKEISRVFKETYIHLGGDEVDFSCWESNPEITTWMVENNIEGNYAALQNYYTQKLMRHVTSLGLTPIVWEEVFTSGADLPKHTVVNVWIPEDTPAVLQNVTAAGHRAIVSSYWYLSNITSGGDWLSFYNSDPLNFTGTDQQKSMVLGGEASMWSEVVDENNLESRAWPRACAAAEKFWSANQGVKATIPEQWPVASRLQEQTCRMNRRGIKAQPPTGPSVCF